jgi:hypothetical protein
MAILLGKLLRHQNQGIESESGSSSYTQRVNGCGCDVVPAGLSSSIRTMTVGSGLSPDLLTSFTNEGALAGFPAHGGIPPVGIFTPP